MPAAQADDTKAPTETAPASAAVDACEAAAAAKPRAQPPAAGRPDDELLEFLGSVDAKGDEDWIDYLSQTDIAKVAKAEEAKASQK